MLIKQIKLERCGVRRLAVAFIRKELRSTFKEFRASNVRTINLVILSILVHCVIGTNKLLSSFPAEMVMKATSSRRAPNYFLFRQNSSPAAPRISSAQVDGSGTPEPGSGPGPGA